MKSLLCSKSDISYRTLPLHLGKSFSIEESEVRITKLQGQYFKRFKDPLLRGRFRSYFRVNNTQFTGACASYFLSWDWTVVSNAHL